MKIVNNQQTLLPNSQIQSKYAEIVQPNQWIVKMHHGSSNEKCTKYYLTGIMRDDITSHSESHLKTKDKFPSAENSISN